MFSKDGMTCLEAQPVTIWLLPNKNYIINVEQTTLREALEYVFPLRDIAFCLYYASSLPVHLRVCYRSS